MIKTRSVARFILAAAGVLGTSGIAALALTVRQSGGIGRPFDIVRWDLDGDRRTDVTVWRPREGSWFTLHSTIPGHWSLATFGSGAGPEDDRPVPGDYDGDGRSDFAVWRPRDGFWYILTSRSNYTENMWIQWGLRDHDQPVPADYDGDGATDVAIFRPATGSWHVKTSSSGFTKDFTIIWGTWADWPVVGDYDGDGRADIAVYRGIAGRWFILLSHMNYSHDHAFVIQWGGGAGRDFPLVGDYDGDGMSDLAIWRDSPAPRWHLLLSSANFQYTHAREIPFGEPLANDVPLAGDYDGDGRTDLVLWERPTGRWSISRSSTDYADAMIVYRGNGLFPFQDLPIPR